MAACKEEGINFSSPVPLTVRDLNLLNSKNDDAGYTVPLPYAASSAFVFLMTMYSEIKGPARINMPGTNHSKIAAPPSLKERLYRRPLSCKRSPSIYNHRRL